LQCDADITSVEIYESWEWPENKNIVQNIIGRGGTKFEPVFSWVMQNLTPVEGPPDILAYLTDGYGSFPLRAPPYPVYWLIPGKQKANIPFGATIRVVED
jgi:predicted metal-dependent peptidase